LKNDKAIDILNYIKRINYFPNVHITYRIVNNFSVSCFNQKEFFKAKNNKNLG